jgi:SAM-dependent methyltransferase
MVDLAGDIVSIYQEHADEWDRTRGRSLFEKQWLDRFLTLCDGSADILDIGCGGGEPIAAYLLSQGHRVTGIDSSAPLIERCRVRFPQGRWLLGDMRTMQFEAAFSGLIAWDSFFHLSFNDQRAMFPLFGKLARPGAGLMFTSGPDHGEAIGRLLDRQLYHASLSPEEYQGLLNKAGFDIVDFVPNDPDCGGHSVWLARRRA